MQQLATPISLSELNERRHGISDAGRPEAVAKQHARGKLTARERIAELVDTGSFLEAGGLVGTTAGPRRNILEAPADGFVTGSALVGGRPVSLCSFDFTVAGGSNGKAGTLKFTRLLQRSLDDGNPFVMLMEGGGHRISEGLDSRHFSSGTTIFQSMSDMSGWVPIVAAVMGPGFAGPTNHASLADFVVMVRPTATMGIAGPALVKAATGEVITKEELGGAAVQADRQGIADLAVESDAEALEAIRRFLSYFPSNARQPLPIVACDDPADRRDEELLTLVPANTRRAYDVRKVIGAIVDRDSIFEIKPTYARNVVTTLARLDGRPVGIVANQALHMGGTLDSNACEKAAHFISMCDAFGLPLVFLIDIPGFVPGTMAERQGLGRRSGRLVYELGNATVPRLSVILRKGYGMAYIAMNGGRSFDPDLVVAWPTAEICAMSIEGGVDVGFRKEIEQAAEPEAKRAELIGNFRSHVDALYAAEGYGIDDVIDPRDTRLHLITTLNRAGDRRKSRAMPPKFHGISPI